MLKIIILAAVLFLPSTHGFKFNNDFPKEPVVSYNLLFFGKIGFGDASLGLCGGMVFVAADHYYAKTPIPQDQNVPKTDTSLYKGILSRFIDSVDFPYGLAKAYFWSATNANITKKTWDEEVDAICEKLKNGPVPLTLIFVQSINPMDGSDNHQVLAYDVVYQENKVIFKIYDPNCPKNDNVTLTCTETEIEHSNSGIVRGFYRSNYKILIKTTI